MPSTTMTWTILTGAKSVDGSIRNWAQHTSVPADQILAEAQAYIYERIRLTEMRFTARVVLAIGDDSVALPTGFLEAVHLQFDGDGILPFIHENGLRRERDTAGDLYPGYPSRWSIIDNEIQFDVELDQALEGDFVYYAPLAALATGNQTNVLTDRFPTLLRRACMAFAYEHRHRTSEMTAELLLVERAIDQANVTADAARRGQIMR